MEFRQLRSFVEVVRQGSFTQAAQVRHASQSTISKQVAQLEQSPFDRCEVGCLVVETKLS